MLKLVFSVLVIITVVFILLVSLTVQGSTDVRWGHVGAEIAVTVFVFGWILLFSLLIRRRYVERKVYMLLLPGFCLMYMGVLLNVLDDFYVFNLFWRTLEDVTIVISTILVTLGVYLHISELQRTRREMEFYTDALARDIGDLSQLGLTHLQILKSADDEATKKEGIEGIKSTIRKTSRLAEAVKILKEIEDTKLEKVDLDESLETSLRRIREYSNREIDVNLSMEKRCYVRANEFLDTMFFNFFELMVEKSSHDPVKLYIQVTKKYGLCVIHIHNYSLTLTSERKKEILETLENLSKDTYLELYVAKRILERFHGTFTLHDMDEETRVTVSIPLTPDAY